MSPGAGENVGLHLKGVMLQLQVKGDGHRGLQQAGFIAHRTSSFINRDHLPLTDIEMFVKKYQTPQAYWRSVMRFIYLGDQLGVEGSASHEDVVQKKREYFASLSNLGEKIFGKKTWSEYSKEHNLKTVDVETAVYSTTSTVGKNEDRAMEPVTVQWNGSYPTVAIGTFDGIGGYSGGERAAEIASYEAYRTTKAFAEGDMNFREAIDEFVNSTRRKMGHYRDESPDMGSTFAIASLDGRRRLLHTAHGGDSKIAVLSEDGTVHYLTRDHNLAYNDYCRGALSEEELNQVTHMIDNATDERDIPHKFRKYWHDVSEPTQADEPKKQSTGRHIVLSSHVLGVPSKESAGADVEASDDMLNTFRPKDNWVAVLSLTDGITDNLTLAEISRALNADQLVSGKITLAESLQSLAQSAKKRSNSTHFRSKPDAGITAAGFLI